MGALINDADIGYLHSLYPSAGLKPLSSQEERFVLFKMQGMSNPQAEKAVGAKAGYGARLMRRADVKVVIEYLREKEFDEVRVSRGKLTTMLLEAHAHAGTATEEILAIKELGKMHDLYGDEIAKRESRQGNTTINIEGDLTVKQISGMSDEQLAQIAGGVIDLDPENYKVINQDDGEDIARREAHERAQQRAGRPTPEDKVTPPGLRAARAKAARELITDSDVDGSEVDDADIDAGDDVDIQPSE